MTDLMNEEARKGVEKAAKAAAGAWEEAPRGSFFGKGDWAAFWVAGLAALAAYFFTLAPTVTLEDSGELAVASDYLGVPHPPGYPIWTLVTWLFQLVFHWVKYNGHPNPAWSVGLASAVAGAGACGILALLISRSGKDLLAGTRTGDGGAGAWLRGTAGVSGGLLLAFSPVMWSQSVIVEVYSLNALFQMAVVLLVYMWMSRPKRVDYLYWAAFLFGLGLTNHQTLLFLMLALVVAIWMKDADLFRDFVAGAAFVAPAFLLGMKGIGWFWGSEAISQMQLPQGHVPNAELWKWSQGPESAAFWIYNYVFLAVPAALWAGWTAREKGWQARLARGALAALGAYLLVVACNRWFIDEPEPRGAEFFETWSAWLWNSLAPAGDPKGWGAFDRCVWQGYAPPYGAGTALAAAGPTFQWVCRLMLLLPLAAALPKLPKGKAVAITMLLAELGVAFYLYLPVASDQNPPMNWGYARTWAGFMHAVTRGQYEAIVATDVFSQKFVEQLGTYLTDLRGQFTLPITVLGFLPFCAWGVAARGRRWRALPVALGLLALSLPLFALEACGVDVKASYKLLVGPILLLAGVGLASMAAQWGRQLWRDWRGGSLGTKAVSAGFAAGLLLGVLWVDVKSLQAIFPTAEALRAAQEAQRFVLTLPNGAPTGFLETSGKAFFLGVVLVPPLALAGAWLLGRKGCGELEMDFGDDAQRWMLTSLVGFFAVSVVFLIFQNPTMDLQQLFIGRVQFIQSHAFYAMWLGYGVALVLACLARATDRKSDAALRRWSLGMMGPAEARRWSKGGMCLAALLLPGVLVLQNAYDDEQLKIVGGAEQNGHSYGWQFGNWGLEGVKGIKEDFGYWYGGEDSAEFKAQWGAYCEAMGSDDPQYPPPMTQGAVFYGGTDPGRFVPTYMIYSADVRSDVYLITQNALADNTFMNITRDLYGDTIYIPSVDESNAAFHRYLADVEAGRVPAGADIKVENGRISVQGVGGVMAINGILAKLIFEENKARHDFYVEESYAIQWMYPYLQPNGIMLKLNAEPMAQLPDGVVDDDHRFWGWYTPWLLGQSSFTRDICARKAFSKLRTAIGGIYEWRRMYDEAEYAYQQAIDLYPLSPEAIFRLAQMRVNWGHLAEAEELLAKFAAEDPHNGSAEDFLKRLQEMKAQEMRYGELRARREGGGRLEPGETVEMMRLARAAGHATEAYQLALELMQSPDTPPKTLLEVARLFAEVRRIDLYLHVLEEYVRREPRDFDAWLELAAAHSSMGRLEDSLRAVKKASELAGFAATIQELEGDSRMHPLAQYAPFREWAEAQTRGAARPAGPRLPPGALGGMIGGGAPLPGMR